MKCTRCGSLPMVPDDPKEVILILPTDILRDKMVSLISMLNYDYLDTVQLVKVTVPSFKAFIEELRSTDAFSSVELEKIACIVFDESSPPNFSHLASVRPLGVWFSILEQEEFLQLLADDRITMYFQPVLDARTLEVVGFELLARGLAKDGKIMMPSVLFALARKTDTLFYLDRRCRELAVETVASKGLNRFLTFVNFVPSSIYDPEYCLGSTIQVAKNRGVDPHLMVFEVVETEKVEDVKHLGKVLETYRAHGFSVALDDIGAGYSGLNVLIEIKPDIVKISRDIIGGVDKDHVKATVFDALVELARKAGIKVVAEGIETVEEFERVRNSVDLVQGFLFGEPSPEPIFETKYPRAFADFD